MSKVYDVPWLLRAQPASERSPATAEMRVVVTLDSKAYAFLRRMQDALVDPVTKEVKLHGEARKAALNEMHALMELHYFAQAHLLTQDEIVVKGLDRMPETDASSALREAAKRWSIPESVIREAEQGQLRMDAPGALGPEPVQEPDPEPDPFVEKAVGEPGARGGAVPPMSLPEAQELFERWRGEEYGWLRARMLLLALERGHYHSEFLVGLTLSQPNLIGAATNALMTRGYFVKGDASERYASSPTSRRKSDVYRLTDTGRAVAREMIANARVVAWAYSDGRESDVA